MLYKFVFKLSKKNGGHRQGRPIILPLKKEQKRKRMPLCLILCTKVTFRRVADVVILSPHDTLLKVYRYRFTMLSTCCV